MSDTCNHLDKFGDPCGQPAVAEAGAECLRVCEEHLVTIMVFGSGEFFISAVRTEGKRVQKVKTNE